MDKRIVLVDKHDNPIRETDVLDAHRGEGKRHRAISVFLFNKKGELLLQQRSAKKIVGALQWANTCCGNVRPGETREACAYRRLKEELGITEVVLQPLYTFEYHVQCNPKFSEWEMDHVFIGEYDREVRPNPDEVKAYMWKKPAKINEELSADLSTFVPWLVIMLKDERLLAYIKKEER